MTENNNLQMKPYSMKSREKGGVRFSFVSRTSSCGIMLYDRTTGMLREKIPFTEEDRTGYVYCKTVDDIEPGECTYLFYEEDRLVPDERAKVFPGKTAYGKKRGIQNLRAGFDTGEFDWGEDCSPRIPYSEMIGYCLHVRGFTGHASSGVSHRGTFAGIREKLPYLKEIGVTTLELQPAYEFTELPLKEEEQNILLMTPYGISEKSSAGRLNYWGYKKGYYYAPKAAYAAAEDAPREFRELVRALHGVKMELVMQFYFPGDVNRNEIAAVLHYWVKEYHVDGFHLLGENLPMDLLASDDLLADTKLWYYHFDTERIYGRAEQPLYPHLGEYNDTWYYEMRKFLKGDGNMLGSVLYHMRHIPEKAGCIHYLTNYFGFTLADLVSYDYKHNEANGEDNRDGNDYNASWNCGEEGTSRRQSIKKLRIKQMKNAMCLLLLSQSSPLIFMGDEFANSQKGNNNPYCQDNGVAWLDWKDAKKNAEILEFWKMLITFRRKYPILHPDREPRLMDYLACGYPDLSYHGKYAWQPQTENGHRHVGIMICGKYAKSGEGCDDTFLYIAINMHWESHKLALPRLPRGVGWETAFSTEIPGETKTVSQAEEDSEWQRSIMPRSIQVYVSSPAKGMKA